MTLQLTLTCIVVWLALWWEHWFPWQALLRRELPRVAAYVMGTLALIVPLSALYGHWLLEPPTQPGAHLIALWVVVVNGGVAVVAAYGIDLLIHWLAHIVDENELLRRRNDRTSSGQDQS